MRTAALIACLLALLAGASAKSYSSGGSCVAIANAQVEADAQSACINAWASAVKHGCSATQGDTLVHDFANIFRVSAYAVAKVTTYAFAQCSTYGNAFGCAAGKAHAMKWAYAHFDAVATASAEALNKCTDCDPYAAAYVSARLLIDLVAGAFARVEAGVCVGPNQTAKAKALEHCCAIVIADGFARACATALIKGGCMSQTAIAAVQAKVSVETNQYCACRGWKYVSGSGWKREATRDGDTSCSDWDKLAA